MKDPVEDYTFWNWSGLVAAIEDEKPLVITETPEDTLALKRSGYPWVVSLPVKLYQGQVYQDQIFHWNNEPLIGKVKTFILSGNNEESGQTLNHEIQKRLRPERCKFIEYPEGYKSLSDVLAKFGKQSVLQIILKAKDYPVVGLYKPDEFPIIPAVLKKAYSTGMGWSHDEHIKILLGKFMVVTGIPGHGKSEWADNLILNLAKKHDWKICVCSTEIDNEEYEENSIRRILRRPMKDVADHEPVKAKKFYQDHFVFVTNNTMDSDLELSLEKLVELAEIAIIRHGCKVLLLDPWNEIEHKRNRDETETEYTGRAIRVLKKLARQYHILVIVVAHPTKPNYGKVECPNLYSISGSANWANKADYGVIVWRDDVTSALSEIRIAKIKRHGPMGKPGSINVKLNDYTGHFEEDRN